MKYLFLILLAGNSALARDVYVRGHLSNHGATYVQPSHRTSPDSNPYNNYGYTGLNPYNPEPIRVQPVAPVYNYNTGYEVPSYGVGEINE